MLCLPTLYLRCLCYVMFMFLLKQTFAYQRIIVLDIGLDKELDEIIDVLLKQNYDKSLLCNDKSLLLEKSSYLRSPKSHQIFCITQVQK